ncbi:bacillithiol biosynthesis cysteine-adding enzyme BshC [Planktosalinus lacus]|uniref:Putative cysteine ligase BshC n=1 Tax=Planktosalinus lacus TaxID=1526573 RepID=A0A8J2V970_9FLAO|nr:bacillithiol biosynthesis cysteine-adding enzyme BshC [Planktosalinus lacus]GGD85222.1 putative cysteine ligase BshC [Planktosalinus lacus]
MPKDCIPYRDTGYFTDLILDYLNQDKSVEFLYHRFPTLENFGVQIQEKTKHYPNQNRKVLVETINKQYKNLKVSEATATHLKNLEKLNTFTVTTGHQLNLFTGPLYFLYKIISTINLCKKLKKEYPENNFVPLYWMANEDHDFDEINFFNFKDKKVVWERNSGGAVGEISTEGLENVYESFAKSLGSSPKAQKLKTLFKEAYLNHNNLTEATRFLAHSLFDVYGLIILDANEHALKQLFVPQMKTELFTNEATTEVEKTNAKINALAGKNYKLQVNPREINLFYLREGLRERIIKKNDLYFINNTQIQFSETKLQSELENHPERFSPNVIFRPLYQEVILPNVCYIGGGGELAYWLQLKSFFEKSGVPFPVLLLRNSALLCTQKQLEKLEKLSIDVDDLFLPQHKLETNVTKQLSNISIDLSSQRKHLRNQFNELYELAKKTDPTFEKMVAAQETKQINGLDRLEKRLLKAQKRKLEDHLNRVTLLQNKLFPNGSLQERTANFSEFYLEYGDSLLELLFEKLDPLQQEFICLELKD